MLNKIYLNVRIGITDSPKHKVARIIDMIEPAKYKHQYTQGNITLIIRNTHYFDNSCMVLLAKIFHQNICISSRITACTIFYSAFQNYTEEMDSHL